jgi:hypothetical protein
LNKANGLNELSNLGKFSNIDDVLSLNNSRFGDLLIASIPLVKLKPSLRQYYSCHHDLVHRYGISVSQMTTDMLSVYILMSFDFPFVRLFGVR